jgi:phosphoribosylamine--glycine ligase
MWQKVEERIIKPTVQGLRKEKIPYKGFIFFGLISVGGEPFVIEYNCRMGDPETEVVIPRLKNDLVQLLENCAKGTLGRVKIRADKRAVTTIMLVSGGYPGDYEKGKVISGLDQVKGSIAFHAGTSQPNSPTVQQPNSPVLTNGGRVIALTSYGKDLASALRKSRRNAKVVDFEGKYYRRDIGKDVV